MNIFEFAGGRKTSESKCYVTHGTMGHLDPKQPPVKRKPYAAVLAIPFVHKVELILPRELYEIIRDDLTMRFPIPVYSRVNLPLSSLVEGDFFNEYIKKGDVLMLSEGVHGVDNIYSLKDGVLKLSLDKEDYERAGLVGKPDGVMGKRGSRPRWIVEINLRLPSMLHGKKGFDRIVYAFQNVLTKTVTWLFSNLRSEVAPPHPLQKHFPVTVNCTLEISTEIEVHLPGLKPPDGFRDIYEDDFSDFSVETYEWISLVSLNCPRVDPNDRIDPFLSRYAPPAAEDQNLGATRLVKISWNGFASSSWAHNILVQALLAAKPGMWFSYTVLGFEESIRTGGRDCTILKPPGEQNEYILWEVEQ